MKEPRAIILDTGPLVALVNRDDGKHETCRRTLRGLVGVVQVYTVTSVLAEAFSLLPSNSLIVDSLFNLLSSIGCKLVTLEPPDLPRAHELMCKYADLPMDFADCEVVVASEKASIDTIFTLDKRDFLVYRPKHFKNFRVIPE